MTFQSTIAFIKDACLLQLPLLIHRQQTGLKRPRPAEDFAQGPGVLPKGAIIDPLMGQRRWRDETVTVGLQAAPQLQQGQIGGAKVFFLIHEGLPIENGFEFDEPSRGHQASGVGVPMGGQPRNQDLHLLVGGKPFKCSVQAYPLNQHVSTSAERHPRKKIPSALKSPGQTGLWRGPGARSSEYTQRVWPHPSESNHANDSCHRDRKKN
jgi:hypothetical protein